MTSAQFDLVIRGGDVHDGDGGAPITADVAVLDGKIAEIGDVRGAGREEIDARGQIVTPGFVDIHTHYDGQAVWDDSIAPSAWHGVTTVLMGNCGVGFAPCKPENRKGLIDLMEGVEDIPAPVMHEGLPWNWESFGDYLDVLEGRSWDIDVCALLPHAPLRVYVMGDRALRLEPATPDDVAEMRRLVAEAVRAGAFGVSTSRSTAHRNLAGEFTPTLLARERELVGLAQGMADGGRGFLEFVAEVQDPDVIGEFEMMRRALRKSGRPGVYSLVQSGQIGADGKDLWRDLMEYSDEVSAQGVDLRPVVAPRSVGLLLGLEGSQHPFAGTATYHGMAHLPLAERVARMSDPRVKEQILAEDRFEFSGWALLKNLTYERMYRFGNPPNYTPDTADSLAAIAQRAGRRPEDVAYDVLLEDDGLGFIHVPFANYASGDLRTCEEMLANPRSIMGLGDGGAHVGFILDAGFQTWMLTYWVKERGVLEVGEAVRRMTSDTADVMGLRDRGRIRRGLRADLNVIDLDQLAFGSPYAAYDLPKGGRRLLQKAAGYTATVVAGEVTYRDGEATGARPGRLVRSAG
ncbi:N-acyl-D-amino-acid deacylase family protein [Nocardia alni]|uniref:N-acyl-D-amino-acid deacylase family protein n=1 Tax=Nocardia alni TaxID=2815723 RepID=UPI001C22F55E|nr:amidohydrolase family protein [Nocardia alni]